MESDSIKNRNLRRDIILASIFAVINTITVILVLNSNFFIFTDKHILSIRITLIVFGICFGLFFIILKYLKHITIIKLFLIIVVTHVVLFAYFSIADHYLDMDFPQFKVMAEFVLEGRLFTPYEVSLGLNWWRLYPPVWIWWYTYNYWVYGLNEIIWRFLNVLLGIGICFVMIKLFQENEASERGFNEDNFKIGLSFFGLSIIPIYAIVLIADIAAFPVLLGVLGFLFLFRAKKDEKNIYFAIFFFSLCALTQYFGAIWIFTILATALFRKKFKQFFLQGIEVVLIFCLASLPMLINDAIGFMQRLLWAGFGVFSFVWNGTIWANADPILNLIPMVLAIVLCTVYIFLNRSQNFSLDIFIITLSIFLFFSPYFGPWYFLWLFPLISLNLIYSFRKYLIANIFFLGYFLFNIILFAIGFLLYPGVISLNFEIAYVQVFGYMKGAGYFTLLQLVGQPLFQMGFVYLIYSYTSSKKWVVVLLLPFLIYYTLTILTTI